MMHSLSDFPTLQQQLREHPNIFNPDLTILKARMKVLSERKWSNLKPELEEVGISLFEGVEEAYSDFTYIMIGWRYHAQEDQKLWNLSSGWSIYNPMNFYSKNVGLLKDSEGNDLPEDELTPVARLIKNEGYVIIGGSMPGYYLLTRSEHDSHKLYFFFEGAANPYPLTVQFKELISILVNIRGLNEFIFYLTEEYPKEFEFLPYDGFFEKVEYLFPEVDLTAFNRHGIEPGTTSMIELLGKYNYSGRLYDAFHSVPDGAFFQRWHSDADVFIPPDELERTRLFQLRKGFRIPLSLEAFYLTAQRFKITWGIDDTVLSNFEFFRLAEVMFVHDALSFYKVEKQDAPNLAGKYVLYSDPYNDMLVQYHGDGECSFHLLYLEGKDYETHFITEDFDVLIGHLTNTRGMFWWNYFLVFKPTAGDARYSTFYNNMRNYFPDADMSRYPDPASL